MFLPQRLEFGRQFCLAFCIEAVKCHFCRTKILAKRIPPLHLARMGTEIAQPGGGSSIWTPILRSAHAQHARHPKAPAQEFPKAGDVFRRDAEVLADEAFWRPVGHRALSTGFAHSGQLSRNAIRTRRKHCTVHGGRTTSNSPSRKGRCSASPLENARADFRSSHASQPAPACWSRCQLRSPLPHRAPPDGGLPVPQTPHPIPVPRAESQFLRQSSRLLRRVFGNFTEITGHPCGTSCPTSIVGVAAVRLPWNTPPSGFCLALQK